MKADFITPFSHSLLNVLATMAQLELKPGKSGRKIDGLVKGDISGLIGMVGPQTKGSFSISFEQALVLEIMRRTQGSAPANIDDGVIRMVAEITNMVTGGVTRMLGEQGYEFDMATPVIVCGPNHTVTHSADGTMLMMPFESDYGRAAIEISFE